MSYIGPVFMAALPLSKNEVVQIMEANKRGFLTDDQATDLLSNPNQARQYLATDHD